MFSQKITAHNKNNPNINNPYTKHCSLDLKEPKFPS